MEFLGYLVWWRVSNVVVPHSLAEKMMRELGFEIPPPNPVLPIDAFRRLTGEARAGYDLDDQHTASLELHKAESQDTMLVRHIVRTVKRNGVTVSIDKVGDAAFYKPPRGKPSKARMRVTVHDKTTEVEAFGASLRNEYDLALKYLDAQALRRLVRQYLTSVDALYLDGPYFLQQEAHVVGLERLFERLGPDSRCQVLPVADDPRARRMLATAVPMKLEEQP
jgi:hypothetical protein